VGQASEASEPKAQKRLAKRERATARVKKLERKEK